MLNQQVLQGHWNEIRGKLRERWGALSDQELEQFEGNVDQLIGTIQRKSGEAREQIEHYLEDITSQYGPAAREQAEHLRHTAEMQAARVRESMRQGYGQAEEMVRSRPGESLAAAFGIGAVCGLVIGLMLRSR